MTGVPRHIAEHWLNIREGCPSVKQKRRSQAANRNQAIQEEVEKLVDAGIMKEVHYHSWLSNPVMVKKHDDSRMCVDFKDLNKACPKDGYALPEIDWKVESLCGFPFKCFLDAYKGYHQIKMAKEDEENTTFITSQGVFCYSKMHFGLRNAGETYQRLVDKAFHKQISRNLECTKKSDFHWTEEAEAAFKQMKQLIVELPTLTVTEEKEELIVYLAAAKEAVSAVLMTEREAKQMPIYFISRTLRGPKVNYTSMEKLVLALVHASKHLKRYSQAHPIIVVTYQPIKQVLSKPEVAGRLQKWSIELGEYAIHYRPRVFVKGQMLADFIVEHPDTTMDVKEELPKPWTLFTNGSSCADGSRAGLIITSPEGAEFTYALRFRFEATNNEAEYEALIAGLRIAKEMGIKNLQANVDSSKDTHQRLQDVLNQKVPRSKNKKADALSKIASTSFTHLSKQVLVEELKEKSINDLEVLAVVEEEGNTWMTLIYEYLTEETLLAEILLAYYAQGCKGTDKGMSRLPEGPGKVKFMIVAIDYFTKWIEAKAVATITGNQVKKFVWDNIVCRFGLPREIISDNGKQFRDNPFKNWCEKLCIRQRFCKTSASKWVSRKSKSKLRGRDQGKARCKKQELDGRNLPCSLGTPYNDQI
ncbi:reverse transcriptase domain-containing protein [Tanacetum coccineum]